MKTSLSTCEPGDVVIWTYTRDDGTVALHSALLTHGGGDTWHGIAPDSPHMISKWFNDEGALRVAFHANPDGVEIQVPRQAWYDCTPNASPGELAA